MCVCVCVIILMRAADEYGGCRKPRRCEDGIQHTHTRAQRNTHMMGSVHPFFVSTGERGWSRAYLHWLSCGFKCVCVCVCVCVCARVIVPRYMHLFVCVCLFVPLCRYAVIESHLPHSSLCCC